MRLFFSCLLIGLVVVGWIGNTYGQESAPMILNATFEPAPHSGNYGSTGDIPAGWGVAIRGGGSFFVNDVVAGTSSDPGILVNGMVFYSLERFWNFGLMAEWEQHTIVDSALNVDAGTAKTISILPFIEFHYRAGRFSPYINIGAGFNFNSFDDDQIVSTTCTNLGIGTCGFSPDNSVSFRVGAGTDFFITENLALNIEGAWKRNSGDIDFKVNGVTAATADFNADVGQGLVGLKYYFPD